MIQVVEKEFSFLTEVGFRIATEQDNEVSYERHDGVFVRIFQDPRDKYLGFQVGLMSRPKDALSATELARLAGAPSSRGQFPERHDQLAASAAKAASDLRAYGQRALSGDESIFDEGLQLRCEYTKPFTGKEQTKDPE